MQEYKQISTKEYHTRSLANIIVPYFGVYQFGKTAKNLNESKIGTRVVQTTLAAMETADLVGLLGMFDGDISSLDAFLQFGFVNRGLATVQLLKEFDPKAYMHSDEQ